MKMDMKDAPGAFKTEYVKKGRGTAKDISKANSQIINPGKVKPWKFKD